jgi:protein SMG6
MPSLNIVPGYTILVLDTNIILSSLSAVASIIESLRWTVVIPVPVIMELDGLSSNPSKLGEAAQEAVAYITSHVRSHSTSLKIQTSKGNYLTSLSVRIEQVDLTNEDSWDRCMDDLILKSAIWQDEHWMDRSALLKNASPMPDDSSAVKVVLLSLDRLCESFVFLCQSQQLIFCAVRLKARSRQLAAAGEKDLAAILASGT